MVLLLNDLLIWNSGSPVKFSETSPQVRLAPPRLGEHTEQTLKGMGFSESEIKEMMENNVL